VHHLPNKPLTGHDPENKGDIFKINKTLELWLLSSFRRHKPEAGGFCPNLRPKYIGPTGTGDVIAVTSHE
jgi:hypothetical protein